MFSRRLARLAGLVFSLMKNLDSSLNYQPLQNLLMAGELTSLGCDSAPCPKRTTLVAGSDIDNDGLICHAGEAFAEYPLAGLREKVIS